MTQEEKQLLLKDLCARLPYSVWGLHRGEDLPLYVIDNSGAYMVLGYNAWFNLDTVDFKPYLRPMSSMTEEEKEQCRIYRRDIMYQGVGIVEFYMVEYVNWLDSKHFDWRTDGNGKTLIQLGLALEAPEGMYKND